uniref:Thioredoxin-related transmembrane protein 2 homolog n=1 Tax=Lepeophtheirus salmonis TaxID=72036 RepID=D3PI61_LEPSM|nr:Thioredoxin-related transmembrane protein 2 homolog [Lepeophtheirus salmonis]
MGFKKDFVTSLKESKTLLRPFYIVNFILCTTFPFLKMIRPFCEILFTGEDRCELDMRENEIFFFLLVVVMIRSRKTGSTTMVSYLSSGFIYTKVANLILFFRVDPRMGLVYLVLFTLQAILLPEPTYKGPESIVYFRANGLDDELKRDPRVTWLVTFYTAWSPSSINFAPVFSKVSHAYSLPNLKFGKIDCGRYPDTAAQYHINTSALTRQLPTVIMFQEGKEVGRVPAIISGKIQKFIFKEEDIVQVFDLNNLYNECKKDKKYAAQIKKMEDKQLELEKDTQETKKDR